MQIIRIVIPLLLLTMAQVASAASYRIDFSGTFSNDCIDCGSYETGVLRGTDFSGYVIIPDSGAPEPDEYLQGETVYMFDSSQTYFELDAADDRFDFSGGLDMSAFVFDGDCVYSCADRFALYFRTDDWFFDMGFSRNTAADPMDGEEMPTLAELQQLTLPDDGVSAVSNYFSIGAPPFDGWIANFDNSDIYDYNILDVSVSEIPLPPAVWLFSSALAGLGWMRQKQTA
jgi:hypothetical protein